MGRFDASLAKCSRLLENIFCHVCSYETCLQDLSSLLNQCWICHLHLILETWKWRSYRSLHLSDIYNIYYFHIFWQLSHLTYNLNPEEVRSSEYVSSFCSMAPLAITKCVLSGVNHHQLSLIRYSTKRFSWISLFWWLYVFVLLESINYLCFQFLR